MAKTAVIKKSARPLQRLTAACLLLGAGITAVQALRRTRQETGRIRAVPLLRNFADQALVNYRFVTLDQFPVYVGTGRRCGTGIF